MGRARTVAVEPKQTHKQTFILLHGRGDTASAFSTGILGTELPDRKTLNEVFPNAKFIFLQAPLRELAISSETKFFQWFDVWSLRPGGEETDLQISGLKETVHLVHGTLKEEIALVGADNVVLGGLSQGCASSLISLLLWEGPAFAACLGMCGWLPFRKVLENGALQTLETLEVEDPSNNVSGSSSPAGLAVTALAQKLGYANSFVAPTVFQQVPVFLGHGTDDETVVIQLGQEAASCLKTVQASIQWKEYQELDHWYSPDMLQDIVTFLQANSQFT